MKRSLYSGPDPFNFAPLLALLPVKGKIGRLEALTSSLYARYEKVVRQQKESAIAPSVDAQKKLAAESAMLKQVLDWLAVKPQSNEDI